MTSLGNHILTRLIGRDTRNNEMYGHAGLMRRYCGLTIPLPILGYLQHGWSYGPGIPVGHPDYPDLSTDSHFSLWNPRNEKLCRDLGFHNVRVIGAPLVYLQPPLEPSPTVPDSLLLFPGHSALSEPYAEDGAGLIERYLEEIDPVVSSFQSTTVCLYWSEFEDARIRRRVEDRGFSTTTLGHRDQTPDFVARFQELALRHEYVTSNSYSTALFYSLYLGRKAFVHGQSFINKLAPGRVDSMTQHHEMSRRYPQLEWSRFDDTSYREIGAEEIGASFQLSPEELKIELGWTPARQLRNMARRAGAYGRRKLRLTDG